MTITIAHETVESLDSMAFVEGVSRSQLIDRAIRELFERLEKERGEPYPQR
jgi:metal-responsive CopG/Arc/MetJ family transcriptional regulator